MKKRLLSLFALVASTFSFGQIENGQTAPNFTITDLDGAQHTLYDYLDDGKIVVLDMFATWCGPCWDFHESKRLQDLHLADTNFVVMAVESDPGTPVSNITSASSGNGSSDRGSIGNWTTGVDYIMANDDDIASAFGLRGYPFVVMIMPDKKVSSASARFSSVSSYTNYMEIVNNSIDNNLWFQSSSVYNTDLCGAYGSDDISFQNIGNNTITSATFQVSSSQDGNLDVIEWTGNVQKYESATISYSAAGLEGRKDLRVQVTNVNQQTDEHDRYNAFTWTAQTGLDGSGFMDSLRIVATSDGYSDEFSWGLYDSENISAGSVASGSGYSRLSPGTVFVDEWVPVTPGKCFVFAFNDTGYDGLSWNNAGKVEIFGENGDLLSLTDGSFGLGHFIDLQIWDPNSVQNIQDLAVSVYPNPTEGIVNIVTAYEEAVNIKVFNALGELVKEEANVSFNGNYILDLYELSSGAYFLNIANENVNTTRKISVAK